MTSRMTGRMDAARARQVYHYAGSRSGQPECRMHPVAHLRWCAGRYRCHSFRGAWSLKYKFGRNKSGNSREHGWWCPKCHPVCPGCEWNRKGALYGDPRHDESDPVVPRNGDRMIFRRATGKLVRL